MVALKEKKNYLIDLTKSASLIKELVDKSPHPLQNNKSAAKIWTFLENRFQYISWISIIRIFCKAYNIKLSNCKDVMDNICCYQMIFDKIQNLITKDL